jgi:hypothetical protein
MMNGDHITRPATQPDSSNDPAINGSGGKEQPTPPPRGRPTA